MDGMHESVHVPSEVRTSTDTFCHCKSLSIIGTTASSSSLYLAHHQPPYVTPSPFSPYPNFSPYTFDLLQTYTHGKIKNRTGKLVVPSLSSQRRLCNQLRLEATVFLIHVFTHRSDIGREVLLGRTLIFLFFGRTLSLTGPRHGQRSSHS